MEHNKREAVRIPTEMVTIASSELVAQVKEQLERNQAEEAKAKALAALRAADNRQEGD